MNAVDIIVIVSILGLLVHGLVIGFMRAMVLPVALAVGIGIAVRFNGTIESQLLLLVPNPAVAHILGFLLILFPPWVIINCVGSVVMRRLQPGKASFSGFTNKAFGGALGFAKGILLSSTVLYIFCAFPQSEPFLDQSRTAPYLNYLTARLVSSLPARFQNEFEEWKLWIVEKAAMSVPNDNRSPVNSSSISIGNPHKDRFDSIILNASRRHNLDPLLLKSLIAVESNFNPWAISHKSAMGLTQLMPRTARELKVKNVFDPEKNVDGGARYLRQLLNKHEDMAVALAYYNAGSRWKKNRRLGISYVSKVATKYRRFKERNAAVCQANGKEVASITIGR